MRELKLFTANNGFNYVTFNSNGRRVKRYITQAEALEAEALIEQGDEHAIDWFCYRIV